MVASGNVVHNLRAIDRRQPDGAFEWSRRFDERARELMLERPHEVPSLASHPDFRMAVPTPDHFLPLLYVERGAQMTFVIQSLLLLISGVYYSIEILPQWMQVLARFSPFTYVLEGVRKALIEGVSVGDLLYLVWPLVIMAIVFIPLGIWVFGRAERYAKRTGKLKRVG